VAKIAILKFPGTNCDYDVLWAIKSVGNLDAEIVWYKDFSVKGWDAIIIPGGFSYGDWLRAGAIAARTRAVERIAEAVSQGVPVLGICNGFQILIEAELLPGALLLNDSGKFVCRWIRLKIEKPKGPWLLLAYDGQEVDMPVAHAEGRYYVEDYIQIEALPKIKYLDGWNPNGSAYNIAGIGSSDGLVLGLMPHPERAAEPILVPRGFSTGGSIVFKSISKALKSGW